MEEYLLNKLDAIFELLTIEDGKQSLYEKIILYIANTAFVISWIALYYISLKFLLGYIGDNIPLAAGLIASLLHNGWFIFILFLAFVTTLQWSLAIKIFFKPVRIMSFIGAIKTMHLVIILFVNENHKDYMQLLTGFIKGLF